MIHVYPGDPGVHERARVGQNRRGGVNAAWHILDGGGHPWCSATEVTEISTASLVDSRRLCRRCIGSGRRRVYERSLG